ncbi:MAG: hypothetical protein ACJ79T_17195, partial [Myxococcales bacterium]
MGIGQILEPLRAAARRVRPRAELLAEQVRFRDDAELDRCNGDFLSPRDRLGQSGIVGELNGGLLRPDPVLRIRERSSAAKTCGFEPFVRDLIARKHGEIDVDRRSGVCLVDLHGHAADDCVRHACLAENLGQRDQRSLLGSFHLAPQKAPPAVELEADVEVRSHSMILFSSGVEGTTRMIEGNTIPGRSYSACAFERRGLFMRSAIQILGLSFLAACTTSAVI